MKFTPMYGVILVLLTLFMSIAPQPLWKVVSNQLRNDKIQTTSEADHLFNFTPNHLVVDDCGDWGSETDIKRMYIACDDQFMYLYWIKSLIGSHIDEIYFDVGEEEGYHIETITATYKFTLCGGFCKWNGTNFQLLISLEDVGINLWKSADDRIVCRTSFDQNNHEECCELKIAWSILGSAQTIKIVDRIVYSGSDQAPDGTFIMIHRNQSQCYIMSFYAKSSEFRNRLQEIRKQSIGYYSEGFNASLKIMNFGLSNSALNVSIALPAELSTNLSKTSWNVILGSNETWNKQFKITPKRLGSLNLTAIISSSMPSNTFSLMIPLNLFIIPKMNVRIHHSGQMKTGFLNKLNITITNYEEINAEVSITTYGQFKDHWYSHFPTLELYPKSSVKIVSEITPLAVMNPINLEFNYSYLEIALQFENVPICSSGSWPFPSGPIIVTKPNVEIILNYPKEVYVGETFYVNISAVNKEDEEIMAGLKVNLCDFSQVFILEDDNYKEQTALVSPNSSVTLSFKFKAVKLPSQEAYVELFLKRGINGSFYDADIKVIDSGSMLWHLTLYVLIAILGIIIVGLVYLYWRKISSTSKMKSKTL